ncbi:MAG: uroporphyrinogen decarboxylase family protein [Candidatus Poribacteria bacterium]
MAEMTMRERMLALVQGRPHDRVPFVTYSGIAGVSNQEVWAVLGRNNMGLLEWCGLHGFSHPNCRFESEGFDVDGRKGTRNKLHTPEGTLVEERLNAAISSASSKHYITEPEDYKIILSYFRDITVNKHTNSWLDSNKRLGDDGFPHTSLVRTPYQQLWIQWVSIEDLALHLVDYPELMEEVFKEMFRVQSDIIRVACECAEELPIPYFNFPDNITAPIIGEKYFRKYCLPSYQELADMLAERNLDIPISVHMDGDLKPLWKAIGESPVRMLDSMSPPPDNDTSVGDAVSIWKDMRVGINYPSSVHLREAEVIYDTTMEILRQGGHSGRLQIQISENMPPNAWQKSYPQIVKAIHDFGAIK